MTHDSRDATCGTKKWTRERPTKGGWYWLRTAANAWYPEVVRADGGWVFYSGFDEAGDVTGMPDDVEWQGPIHPEE